MGGGPWNPLIGGRTSSEVGPFYRAESVETDLGRDAKRTNGLDFSLIHDNRDFHVNPSEGSRQRLTITRDWGLCDSTNSWTSLEAGASKFVPLSPPEGFRQQVLAFDFWTAYSPTWEQIGTDDNAQPIYRRPPEFMGPRLGGFWRMRAFSTSRFSDKAAIYYAAEYRLMPEWNPLRSVSWLDWADVKWLQGVIFAETGRVATNWRIEELHKDMKWDVGLGLRVWGKGTVGRVDIAFAEESTALRLMIGQTF
jgi:outer membrane protein assembly factor BamA